MPTPETTRKLREAKLTRRRVPTGPSSRLIERSYLGLILADVVEPMIEMMLAEVPALLAAAGVRSDSLDLTLRATVGDIRIRFGQLVTRNIFERAPRSAAGETNRQSKRIIRRQVKAALGVSMVDADDVQTAALVDAWVARNVALIRTVESRYFETIQRKILELAPGGTRAVGREGIADAITGVVDSTGRTARFNAARIARDQAGKLKAQLNVKRQTDLGVTEYTWDTSNDERVRDLHAERDQRRFKWAEPPNETEDDGHPGEPINCRCVARPVFDFTGPEEAPSRPLTGARPST